MRTWRAACFTLALAGLSHATPAEEPSDSSWRSFAGTWSVAGRREALPVEGGGVASVIDVSGAIVLTNGEGLSRGFRGRAIGLDDGHGSSVGRCAWTDENGDRVFSRIEGESLKTGRRFVGKITGGTGRYAGLTGEYSFTWEYVVAGDEAAVNGRITDLAGRVQRVGGAR